MDNAKPGDFPIGSQESRAAARLKLSQMADTREHVEIVSHIQRPGMGVSTPHTSQWTNWGTGALGRVLYVPATMAISDARQIVDRYEQ
jgi:hypothetical protein